MSSFVLSVIAAVSGTFLGDFGGNWMCGNAQYHERWAISPHPGANATAQMADVRYGDAASPDGFAYVYFVPAEDEWRYDDFHADGGQSHLHSAGSHNGVWTWTGIYYPAGGAADPSVYITWQRTSDGYLERHFAQKINGKTIDRGVDSCTPLGI